MKPRISYYVLLAVTAYAVFLIAYLPAQRVISWVELPKHISLHNVSGSVWNGRAASVLHRQQQFGTLTWRLKPLRLLLGKVGVKWKLRGADVFAKGKMNYHLDDSIELTSTRVIIPLKSLQKYSSRLPVILDGELQLDVKDAVIENSSIEALDGSVRLLSIRSISPVESDIGTFEALLALQDDIIVAKARDLDGPLKLSGQAQLKLDGSYQFSANVNLRTQASAALRDAIQQTGRPAANGSYTLQHNGRLWR